MRPPAPTCADLRSSKAVPKLTPPDLNTQNEGAGAEPPKVGFSGRPSKRASALPHFKCRRAIFEIRPLPSWHLTAVLFVLCSV